MKKSIFYTLIFMMSFVVIPSAVNATENNLIPKTSVPSEIPVEIRPMLDRLNEIKEMDKSDLKREERKALRKEVRAIKKDVRASGNGLYISSGAIIIILLLIIIL